MNGRERKEGETVAIKLCRIRYIVQLCFPHPGPVVNVMNADDIFCNIIATLFLTMIKQRKDRLLQSTASNFTSNFTLNYNQGFNITKFYFEVENKNNAQI